jgi:hypothetical protein
MASTSNTTKVFHTNAGARKPTLIHDRLQKEIKHTSITTQPSRAVSTESSSSCRKKNMQSQICMMPPL